MPSYKSFWSSLSYHTATRPAITLTKNYLKGVGKRFKLRRLQGRHRTQMVQRTARHLTQGVTRKPTGPSKAEVQRAAYRAKQAAFRTKMRAQTRGALAAVPTAWSKKSAAGITRRIKAANTAKALPRPQRRRSVVLSPPKASTPQTGGKRSMEPTADQIARMRQTKPGTPQAAAIRSSNYGTLRRRLGGQAVRDVTRSIQHKGSDVINVKQRANTIRALRKIPAYRQMLRDRVKQEKWRRMGQAASFLAEMKS